MGRKCNDVYGEEKVYYYPGAIVRVRRPILTEEERARRMKIIEKDGGVSEKVRERQASMIERKRQRTRRERAARWAEFWAIVAVCGFLTLIFLLGMCTAFAVVETAW